MKSTVLTAILLSLSLQLMAQSPMLVRDIYQGPKSGSPQNFVVYNNRMYFDAADSMHGNELWYLDNNSLPVLAGEANPGPANGAYPHWALGGVSCGFKGKFYYGGTSPQNFQSIYFYDGVNPPSIAPGCNSFR